MENVMQIYHSLGNFFHGDLSLKNIMDTIRDKFEQYMMDTFNVIDWHCDETWLLHFAKGIQDKKVRELSIEWINEQIAKEARREIMED